MDGIHIINIPQIVHVPPEGHSGCFQSRDIINKVAINIQAQAFMYNSMSFLGG